MVIMKAITPIDLLAYQLVLTNLSEEHGGTRTTYYYDLLLRQKLAKQLQQGSTAITAVLGNLDREVLADAQSKVDKKAKDFGGKDAKGKQAGKSTGKYAGSDMRHEGRGNVQAFVDDRSHRPRRSRSRGRGYHTSSSGQHGKVSKGKGSSKSGF